MACLILARGSKEWRGATQFRVEFYQALGGREPARVFIDGLHTTHPVLHALLASGLEKLRDSANHGKRLTEIVDRRARIWEVRVGRTEIARIFLVLRAEPATNYRVVGLRQAWSSPRSGET